MTHSHFQKLKRVQIRGILDCCLHLYELNTFDHAGKHKIERLQLEDCNLPRWINLQLRIGTQLLVNIFNSLRPHSRESVKFSVLIIAERKKEVNIDFPVV